MYEDYGTLTCGGWKTSEIDQNLILHLCMLF